MTKIKVESDEEEFDESEDEYSSSGGASDEGEDDDYENLNTDPDDESNPNEDDIYEPVEDNEEIEDPEEIEEEDNEEEIELEDVGDAEEFEAETKSCHLKNLDKDFIVLDEDNSNFYANMEYTRVKDEDRISDPIMTYYEMVRVIGTRAQQFNYDAPPLVSGIEDLPPPQMAYIELKAKQTPFIIRRHLPGKLYEEWKIEELEIVHEIDDEFFVPENFDWKLFMKQLNKIEKEK
jgi:DNA-directed RNA polymerase subunit K/omega